MKQTNRYNVKGDLIIRIPFEREVDANNPIDAEELAVELSRKELLRKKPNEILAMDDFLKERPQNISVRFVQESIIL